MIARARCIFPMVGEAPLDNAAILIENGTISWIGRWKDCEGKGTRGVLDFGEVVLLPGLINAHCHLDYTEMAGKIPAPKYFPDWVKTILSLKAHWSYSEYAASWMNGAKMLAATGTTTVYDVESFYELLPELWSSTPLRVISFLEMTGVKNHRQADEVLRDATACLDRLTLNGKCDAGVSPHALYSTTADLVRKVAGFAREKKLPITVHVAESESEFEMVRYAKGPFFEWLKGQRDMNDCGRSSPVRLLHEYGILGEHCLAIHANYLAAGDAELLALTRTSVVHCPRSHDYFGHTPFPYETLKRAGVNICLGTDSLASSRKIGGSQPRLNMWDEFRSFWEKNPGVRPREILEMATVNPAQALGRGDDLGQLKAGASADLISLEYSGKLQESVMLETLLHTGMVRDVLIAGEQIQVNQA